MYYPTVSASQESGRSQAGQFWSKTSHKTVINESVGATVISRFKWKGSASKIAHRDVDKLQF